MGWPQQENSPHFFAKSIGDWLERRAARERRMSCGFCEGTGTCEDCSTPCRHCA